MVCVVYCLYTCWALEKSSISNESSCTYLKQANGYEIYMRIQNKLFQFDQTVLLRSKFSPFPIISHPVNYIVMYTVIKIKVLRGEYTLLSNPKETVNLPFSTNTFGKTI